MGAINKINLKDQFLIMFVEKATTEQLQHINMLLKQGDYKQIDSIIEEYTYNIINNKDLKSEKPSSGGVSTRYEFKEEYSTEDMDPQTFELYCILKLIDEYEEEQDQEKKKMLETQIQNAIEKYRNPEKVKTGKSR
ncbi:MAG: hypothetical protein VZS44_06660 [Bacilli bacterium]|nr:hypothetical protein [Bacilli bacterium]